MSGHSLSPAGRFAKSSSRDSGPKGRV